MVAVFKGESDPLGLINGKEYEVISEENGYFRIEDETGEDYLYDSDSFEVISGEEAGAA